MGLQYGYPDPEDISSLSEELRRKGMQPRQLDKLKAFWGDACLDPMKRGILREPPDKKSGTQDTPAQLPDLPEPSSTDKGLLELLDSTEPFPQVTPPPPAGEEPL